MARLPRAALLLALVLPGPLMAQTDRARFELGHAAEAAARGDTAVALAHIHRAITLQPNLAEAHWRRAEIYIHKVSSSTTDFDARMQAEHSLRAALNHDPNNALYMVELGKIMLKQQVRQDARRVFLRAVKAADRSDPITRAEAHYQLGRFYEARWLRFRDRRLLPMNTPRFSAEYAFHNATYAWEMLNASVPVDEDLSAGDRADMLHHFHTAVRSNPAHIAAMEHLLAFYLDRGESTTYMELAERLQQAIPDLPDGSLAMALGYYNRGDHELAARTFKLALLQMDPKRARNMRALGRILAKEKAHAYETLPDSSRDEFEQRYWELADPVFSTPQNEFWLEYMARVAYADIRYGIPEYNVRGWDTQPGLIYIRYGKPLMRAAFAPNATDVGDAESIARITLVWTYGEHGPVFVFRQNTGFARVDFAEDFDQYADNYRAALPARLFSNLTPALSPLAVQLAQFRGSNGRTELEVHAAAPVKAFESRGGATYHIGLFIRNAAGGEIIRHQHSGETGSQKPVSWRVALADTGKVLVAVEEFDSAVHRVATMRRELVLRRFVPGELQLSDLLLASHIQPRHAAPLGREDYDILVAPAVTFTQLERAGVYFEVYGLAGKDGYADYEAQLTITIKELARSGSIRKALGELADKWGLTREGDDMAQLRFRKEARIAARDAVADYFKLQFPADPPAGKYSLRLTITDRVTGKAVYTERDFQVTPKR